MSEPRDGPLMGIAELATRLGVSRPRASQLTQRQDFPEPYDRLAAGPIWETPVIERWIEEYRPVRLT